MSKDVFIFGVEYAKLLFGMLKALRKLARKASLTPVFQFAPKYKTTLVPESGFIINKTILLKRLFLFFCFLHRVDALALSTDGALLSLEHRKAGRFFRHFTPGVIAFVNISRFMHRV